MIRLTLAARSLERSIAMLFCNCGVKVVPGETGYVDGDLVICIDCESISRFPQPEYYGYIRKQAAKPRLSKEEIPQSIRNAWPAHLPVVR